MEVKINVRFFGSLVVATSGLIIAALLSKAISPLAALVALIGLPAVMAILFRGKKARLTNEGTFSIGEIETALDNILYIYEDKACIIIRLKRNISFCHYGYAKSFHNKILINKGYIRNASELSKLIGSIDAARKSFLISRLPYFLNPF